MAEMIHTLSSYLFGHDVSFLLADGKAKAAAKAEAEAPQSLFSKISREQWKK